MSEDEEFVYAPAHIVTINEEDGDGYMDAVTPACDFCLDMRVRWDYPCGKFYLDEIEFGSSDGWLACDRCAELIEKGLLSDLTARSIRSWMKRIGPPFPDQLERTLMIHQGFLDHREGERIAYG